MCDLNPKPFGGARFTFCFLDDSWKLSWSDSLIRGLPWTGLITIMNGLKTQKNMVVF